MTPWRWIASETLFAVHDRVIADHGGPPGIRDPGAVESALARARNLVSYGDADAAVLATAYAYGLLRNHGFLDGNKRIAWMAARLFLADNGYHLRFDPLDAIQTVERAAAGQLTEAELVSWVRERTSRL